MAALDSFGGWARRVAEGPERVSGLFLGGWKVAAGHGNARAPEG